MESIPVFPLGRFINRQSLAHWSESDFQFNILTGFRSPLKIVNGPSSPNIFPIQRKKKKRKKEKKEKKKKKKKVFGSKIDRLSVD